MVLKEFSQHKDFNYWKETEISDLETHSFSHESNVKGEKRRDFCSSKSSVFVISIWTVSRFSVGDDRENASTKHQRRRSTGQHLYRSNVREKLVPRCFVSFTFRHR